MMKLGVNIRYCPVEWLGLVGSNDYPVGYRQPQVVSPLYVLNDMKGRQSDQRTHVVYTSAFMYSCTV